MTKTKKKSGKRSSNSTAARWAKRVANPTSRLRPTARLPTHTNKPVPIADKGEANKQLIIVVITIVLIMGLASLLFFTDVFVGKAIHFEDLKDIPEGEAGFFLTEATSITGDDITLQVMANPGKEGPGDAETVAVSFTLDIGDLQLKDTCDKSVISSTGWGNNFLKVSCANKKITFEHATLNFKNAKKKGFKIAELKFSGKSKDGNALGANTDFPLKFEKFEILSIDTQKNLVKTKKDATIKIIDKNAKKCGVEKAKCTENGNNLKCVKAAGATEGVCTKITCAKLDGECTHDGSGLICKKSSGASVGKCAEWKHTCTKKGEKCTDSDTSKQLNCQKNANQKIGICVEIKGDPCKDKNTVCTIDGAGYLCREKGKDGKGKCKLGKRGTKISVLADDTLSTAKNSKSFKSKIVADASLGKPLTIYTVLQDKDGKTLLFKSEKATALKAEESYEATTSYGNMDKVAKIKIFASDKLPSEGWEAHANWEITK